ncbi:uncharacterized protein JCM10292_001359 [Rhodotorula paludigena]|uniref:uncharacterized protein n=1 Tax=Rhodotorula paludigena TaxID=86838 RepID=UPI00317B0B48
MATPAARAAFGQSSRPASLSRVGGATTPSGPTGSSALTGTTSGSATPSTSYGSFPPPGEEVESALRSKLYRQTSPDERGDESSPRASTSRGGRRRWERSRERLIPFGVGGRRSDDVYDSDGDASDASVEQHPASHEHSPFTQDGFGQEDGGDPWTAGEDDMADVRRNGKDKAGSVMSRHSGVVVPEGDKQWGVVKMELMSRTWGRKGLLTIYAGLYLISTLTSLEGNTTPTIEPYFLSLLGEHSMLSSVVIVMSIGYAVGKPPMTKILDVFGRAEGICLAAIIYSLGYLFTAAATDARFYLFARALSALGGQGIQLAQQIIVADTTTLANRGLITSTISLPWILTTWIGPPIGAWFQRRGPAGYRAAYAVFGILLPLVACVLFFTLCLEWRKLKGRAIAEGRKPNTRDLGFGVATRASWMSGHSHHRHHPSGSTVPSTASAASSPSRPKRERAPPVNVDADLESGGRIRHERMSTRERREASAAEAAAHELEKRQRWNATPWSKAKEIWEDLDVVGLIALTLGCILFLLPFTLATKTPESWADPWIWLSILVGAGILVFFGYYETRIAAVPLLPPRLLRNRTLVGGSLMGLFHFVSQYCYESFFTSFLQVARGHSPADASYISQTYLFAACISAIVAGSLAKLTNRYKWFGILGVLIHAVGVWLMMRSRDLNATTFELVLSQVVGGIGGGFTTIAVQIGCQSVVSHQDLAIATAMFLCITQIGGAVGGSIAGAVWSTALPKRLGVHLPQEDWDKIPQIIASLPYALSFPAGSPIRLAINRSYVDVQKILNWLALAMLGPGLLSLCAMKDVNLTKEDPGNGEGVVVLGRASFLAVEEDLSASETSSLLGDVSERD